MGGKGNKAGAKKNKWLHCLPTLRKQHPGMKLKELRHYYDDDKKSKRCVIGKKKGAKRKRKGGELIDNFYGNGLSGGEYLEHCGGARRPKHRMMRGGKESQAKRRKVARKNPWINEVRSYANKHGVSFKEAMIALGSK